MAQLAADGALLLLAVTPHAVDVVGVFLLAHLGAAGVGALLLAGVAGGAGLEDIRLLFGGVVAALGLVSY